MGFDLQLMARLGLDSTGFDRGLARAEATASKVGTSISGRLAGFLTAGAFTAQARKTIDFASRINDVASALGVSTERLQEFDYAAKLSGSTLENVVTAMRKLAEARKKAIENPQGGEMGAFAQFGIDFETLRGTSDPAELFLKLGDAVKGANLDLNSMPQLLALIGQRGLSVVPMLTAGVREFGEEAHKAGQVMEDSLVKKLDDLGDAFDRTGKRVTVAFAKPLAWVAQKIRESVGGWQMMLEATGAVMKGGFKNPFDLFSGDWWKNLAGEMNKVRDRINAEDAVKPKRAMSGFDDPEDVFSNQEKLTREAEKRAKLEERVMEKEMQLRLKRMSPSDRISALEAERAKILGDGLEKPSLEQRLKLAELGVDIQGERDSQRRSIRDRSFDSLAAIGGFSQGVNSEDRQLQVEIRNYARDTKFAVEKIAAEGGP